MNWQIGPILSTLRQHRFTTTLLVLQVALTCAIVCNAIFLVSDRLALMKTPSGIDEDRVIQIEVDEIGSRGDTHARTQADLAALRSIPGVEAATVTDSVPFGDRSWNGSVFLTRDQRVASLNTGNYYGEAVAETLGAELVAGRLLRHDEYRWIDDVVGGTAKMTPVAVLSSAAADRLFPDGQAVGRSVILDHTEVRVVGVVRRLVRAGGSERDQLALTTIVPLREAPAFGGAFILRVRDGEAERVMTTAKETLRQLDPRRVVRTVRRYADIRADYFAGDRAMAGLLVGVCISLLTVTALGIVGLASFWVGQRRRQIGVRRALGARRLDILVYFQTENFLLATLGIGLGMLLAYGINLLLMWQYEVPRLPLAYLPVGALILWLLGQAAVLAPAMRAAAVPPVVATRG